MSSHPLVELTLARVREFLREPEAVFWVFIFPVLLTIALGIAFRASEPEPLPVGVRSGPGAEELAAALDRSPDVRAAIVDEEQARGQLRSGKLALVVLPGETWTYWYDPTRPDSRIARLAVDDALQRAAGREDVHAASEREMRETGSRYIDFLVPGLLGMNLMGTGMWGIGFSIVMSRSKHLLRRLAASPMKRWHYLAAQMGGRLVFLVLEIGAIILCARWLFGVPLRGSWLAFCVCSVAGAIAFSGLGLLVASRAKTIEGVSGLMNLVMVPMWIGSGVFFSTGRFPDVAQPFIQALPLTAVIDSLRSVMLDGASLAAVSGELSIVAAWTVVSFGAALALFRWT